MHVLNAIDSHNQANTRSQSYWSSVIRDSWQKSAAGIFETGNLLLQARDELDRDGFNAMKLPFGIRTRQMLMRIAAHPVLANHGSRLPPCWRTLYELTKLPDDILLARLEDGTINPGMERRDATALLNRPKKKSSHNLQITLETLWAKESEQEKTAFFDKVGVSGFRKFWSSNFHRTLLDSVRIEKFEARPEGTMSDMFWSVLSLLASIDAPGSDEIVRKANTYQLLAELRTLDKMVRAAGNTKEIALSIVDAGTINAIYGTTRDARRAKKRAAA